MSGRALCGWCQADMGERAGIVGVSHGICERCTHKLVVEDPESPVLPPTKGSGDGAANEIAHVPALTAGGEPQRVGLVVGQVQDERGAGSSVGAADGGRALELGQQRGPDPLPRSEAHGVGPEGDLATSFGVEADGDASGLHQPKGMRNADGLSRRAPSQA